MTRSDPFVLPVLTTPLDLAAHVAGAPAHGKVKGMFFRRIVEETRSLTGRAIDGRPYFPFSDYPLPEWLNLLHDAARYAYPREPVRVGLRRLGRSMFPTFAETTVGKVIFSVAGNSVMRALPLYPKIWSVISNHGTAEVDELRPGRVLIRLRYVWDFVDCFQVGSLEGGMAFFGVDAAVKVHVLSACDADYEIRWTTR
jgi:uncharacterized protein (TIGR02265 family)